MNLTKEKFMFATDLISKRTDMLRGKEKSLYNLYDICNTTEQRELVRQLLLDFNEMTADVFNLCLIEMSKYILSFGYPLDECMVTAMAHDHMPDSSQGVLNSIKVPLWRFRRKVTPCVRFKVTPLSDFKMTPTFRFKVTPTFRLKVTPFEIS